MSDNPPAAAAATTRDIKIDPPIEAGNQKYDVLRLREPLGGEVLAAEEHYRSGINMYSVRLYNITLISRVSGWPEKAVKALPVSTLELASAYLATFVGQPSADTP